MTATARKSRRVLVVGATGRLGVAIGEALADRGDEVILTARDPNKLEQQAAALARPSTGNKHAPFVCADLTHRDAVERIVEGLRAAVPTTPTRGSVDDIVLACGPFPRTPFDDRARSSRSVTPARRAPTSTTSRISPRRAPSRPASARSPWSSRPLCA